MFYLQTIKALSENIKKDGEIPAEEKEKATALLAEVARIVALY